MTWNMEEFRELCADRRIPDTEVYQNTLVLKAWRAHNFGERSLEVWRNLFSRNLTVGDEDWNKTWFESESYAEAALQALHSMADVMAQIINVAVLNGHFSEAKVTLRWVQREITNRRIAPDVATAIQQLIDSDEFSYTNAFVNTIKHRRLLDTQFRAESGGDTRNDQGLLFERFTYNQMNLPTMWLSDFTDTIIPCVHNHIDLIGNALNDHLR